jgi:hypothetical protein
MVSRQLSTARGDLTGLLLRGSVAFASIGY